MCYIHVLEDSSPHNALSVASFPSSGAPACACRTFIGQLLDTNLGDFNVVIPFRHREQEPHLIPQELPMKAAILLDLGVLLHGRLLNSLTEFEIWDL